MAEYIPNPLKWVYSKIREAVNPLCPYTNTTAPTSKAKFPCHTVMLLGSLSTARTLEMDEDGIIVTIQSDSYTSGERFTALNTAYAIDELAHAAYIQMGFARVDGPRELPSEAEDETVKRVTSRYRRTFAKADFGIMDSYKDSDYDGGDFSDYDSGVTLDGGALGN